MTVPQDAQQVLVFLAPESSGDFSTLVDAVRGRPGAFVRASQDLNQAMLDRSRLEAYLSAIHAFDATDPVKAEGCRSAVGAKSGHQSEREVPRQDSRTASAVFNAGGGIPDTQRWAQHLDCRGAHRRRSQDLAMEASFTPQLSYGYYSP